MLEQQGSTPSFSEFNPDAIPWQTRLIDDLTTFDYSLGVHEVLLSGSVGSGKSLPAAHCALRHLLHYGRSRCILGRRAMPDLRDTIFAKLCEHLDGTVKADGSLFKEGKDFGIARYHCRIWFANGSEVISRSWADTNHKKLGSIEASIAIVEELSENDADDEIAIRYLRMRVGRLPHVPEQWIIYCTNPDSPAHFAYKYFQIGERQAEKKTGLIPTRHVYFSLTDQNPFIPDWYIRQLEDDLDPKLARRMLKGEWLELYSDVIYHQFKSEKNFRDEEYMIDLALPIYIAWDFNIGEGKPLSLCLSQYLPHKDEFHFFGEVVIDGASTEEACEELAGRGFLDHDTIYMIQGDATGGARSTKSKSSDYDIIRKFFANYRTKDGGRCLFEIDVPSSNPPIRTRHNLVNAYCQSTSGKTRLFVYRGAKTLLEGLRLTALRKGGSYIEDDSKPYQHITTAAGYHIHRCHRTKTLLRPKAEVRRIR